MKKKGFTLIELLAVIVILAVIALITVPIIINVVENAQKKSFEDSAYGIIKAGNLYYMENIDEKEGIERYDFAVNGNKFTLKTDETKELKFTGTMPKSGELQLHGNGNTAIAICNSKYCACKSVSEVKVTIKKESCQINSETGEITDNKDAFEERVTELETKLANLEKDTNDKIKALEKEKVKTGTVISYMGKNVPEGYLPCDGRTYDIKDYSALAEQIKKEFGSYNYFGGDGTNTFKVPDLRGEFLRGTGTNSHANQGSGGDVGTHQDATEDIYLHTYLGKLYVSNATVNPKNQDTMSSATSSFRYHEAGNIMNSEDTVKMHTARPTNTSVFYCIKY